MKPLKKKKWKRLKKKKSIKREKLKNGMKKTKWEEWVIHMKSYEKPQE